MLQYEKNILLTILLQFEAELIKRLPKEIDGMELYTKDEFEAQKIISRNLQSIKKQINKL